MLFLFSFLFNPVFHNVTPVAHGLKLVITRKINLKIFEIFFYNLIIRLCIEKFISYLQIFFHVNYNIFFIINNYSNHYFGTIEPLNGSIVTKNLTFFSRKVSLDGTLEPFKRSNRLYPVFSLVLH